MRALRRDAQRSRDALLTAFLELVRERGEDVPMYEIARRAGVGQGTLYRHFPQRDDLAAAVFERVNDDLESLAAAQTDDPGLLRDLLATISLNQARMHSLSVALWSGRVGGERTVHLRERTLALLEDPLRVAQRAGLVRADLTARDLVAITAMVEGVLMGVVDAAEREAAARRALDLVWEGVGAGHGDEPRSLDR
jgi:AcrR family transcriptional regulator